MIFKHLKMELVNSFKQATRQMINKHWWVLLSDKVNLTYLENIDIGSENFHVAAQMSILTSHLLGLFVKTYNSMHFIHISAKILLTLF